MGEKRQQYNHCCQYQWVRRDSSKTTAASTSGREEAAVKPLLRVPVSEKRPAVKPLLPVPVGETIQYQQWNYCHQYQWVRKTPVAIQLVSSAANTDSG